MSSNTQAYHISGKNNTMTLIFLHGLGANNEQFLNEHEIFGKNYKVISINIQELYISCFRKDSDIDLKKLAKAIVKLLREELNISKCHIVGNSMGGNIAYEIYNYAPELLESLTTFGTTAELKTGKVTLFIVKKMFAFLSMNTIAKLSSYAGRTKPSSEIIQKMMKKADKNMITTLLPILENFNYLPILETIHIPVLIIQGGKDVNINNTIHSTIETLSKKSNFSLKKIEEAGHFANLDTPNDFHSILENFIKTT